MDEALKQADAEARVSQFNLQVIDSLVLDGHLALTTGDIARAKTMAKEAHNLSWALAYRWGIGDAAHLLAKCEDQREQYPEAMAMAVQAVAVRTSLKDPRAQHTEALIQKIRPYIE